MADRITGSQALVRSLEHVGVDVVFGIPGGAVLPVYDPILDSPIRHILVRHEQGAGHMAQGYYWATGRPGVALVTSGPGVTNILTPITDAFMDSVPIVVIAGQVARAAIGSDAFQEAPTFNMTMPVTKHNFVIMDAAEIPEVIAQAFHIATTGRPGPVYVDLPKDVGVEEMDWWWPEDPGANLPGYKPNVRPHAGQVKKAVELITAAQRPVVYAGGGILKARAAEALRDFCEKTGIHAVTTLMARGALSDEHPLCLGMPGMHGSYTAVTSMQKSDLLIALGSRFDDRVTGRVADFAPHAKVVHVDIDPAELSKVRAADVPIVADCRLAIEALIKEFDKQERRREERGDAPVDRSAWNAQIDAWRSAYPYKYVAGDRPDVVKPQYVLERLNAAAPDAIVTAGVGQHQMFASQWWRFREPYHWINSGGLGTMGFAVPAAVGAQVGAPDKVVWCVDGDGCFQMTMQELITASVEGIPVKVAILNNGYLGMVRQWQDLFYDERHSEIYLSQDVPDYVGLAEAMGCAGFRVDTVDEVDSVIAKAMAITDRPVVVDFRIDPAEHVYPMVPAGKSNDGVILGPAFGQPEHQMAGDGAAPMTSGGEGEVEPPPEHPDGHMTLDKGGF
ncbi:MAG: biosynthetic-type acetolactate synthase large subunit [Acidimicrobiia bacterium]|nr:biosynthetic-type acetolactate synthase large subunit [Acidimicrobiia bacterium]